MSVRLQVLLDDDELQEIRSLAERQRMTVSEWVRQTLRAARLDSNIPMYLVGAAHPNKIDGQRLLERCIVGRARAGGRGE